ncbi:hypothetical protein NNJEOMEG_01358 [Fundidesulfovibrio magnetotacticus]|uniref:Uncharacterized protein n=1 Tax=Fundidesulfovibrio magnetotacticus TaxID=2730080 RepID=A0A6V8LP76_9BACT|nr:hypothetical protein [Fundidesulfovibrio magnetotacticus]GFK93524.1 hypothetical protein NNJEOMEG_01358 [Fundidesulfovibrio magnetotacticus]
MSALSLRVGQSLGIRPEVEGPAPVLAGGTFEVFFFYADLTEEEVRAFTSAPLACGVYVEDAIPVLVLDIEGFGGLEVAFNLFAEPEEKRRAFLETVPARHEAIIVLCDHPDPVVRAVRQVRAGPMAITEIKRALFDQLSLYRDMTHCFQAMSRLFASVDPEEIRGRTLMRPA